MMKKQSDDGQLSLFRITMPQAIAARDEGMATVEKNAGADFRERAVIFAVEYLGTCEPAIGEDIVDACKEAGIVPHNDKAFGPVILKLLRDRKIEKCGTAPRRKGHGAPGAQLYRLVR